MPRALPTDWPEELLSQLARTASLKAVCVPIEVRRERPRLAPTAQRLAIDVTLEPLGNEDMLCLLAAPASVDTLAAADAALPCFERAPFLLLIRAEHDVEETAVTAAKAFVAQRPGWFVRDLTSASGPALLSPVQRLLEADALAGEWHGAGGNNGTVPDDQTVTLTELWRAAEEDRRALAAIVARIRASEAQVVVPRGDVELTRLRSAERREADRLRLLLSEERAWVAEQAMRLAASQSWRIGHRLTRIARLLAFKTDRGTNLPAMIAERMEEDDSR